MTGPMPGPMPGEEQQAQWRALGAELIRHGRSLHLMKAHLAAQLPAELDLAALGLLHHLSAHGPCRQGELAGTAQLDPSTVSRHVAQLVRAGYANGRFTPRTVASSSCSRQIPEGRRATASKKHRHALIARIMANWDEEDVRHLTDLADPIER